MIFFFFVQGGSDDDSEEVGDDLDDEAMMRIDEALATAFKSHLESKQKNKDKKGATWANTFSPL